MGESLLDYAALGVVSSLPPNFLRKMPRSLVDIFNLGTNVNFAKFCIL